MPDLTIENYYACADYDGLVVYIKSGDGKHKYRCEYHNYSWDCDCKGFKFRHTCKHIKIAEKRRCQWSQYVDGGKPYVKHDGTKTCPECGGEVIVVKMGV